MAALKNVVQVLLSQYLQQMAALQIFKQVLIHLPSKLTTCVVLFLLNKSSQNPILYKKKNTCKADNLGCHK